MTDINPLDYLSATAFSALDEATAGADSLWQQRLLSEAKVVASGFEAYLAGAENLPDYQERTEVVAAGVRERLESALGAHYNESIQQAAMQDLHDRTMPVVAQRSMDRAAALVARVREDQAAFHVAQATREAFNESVRQAMYDGLTASLEEDGFSDAMAGQIDKASMGLPQYRDGVARAMALTSLGAANSDHSKHIAATGPLDRSLMFTLMLQYPQFAQMESREGSALLSDMMEDWAHDHEHTDMATFVKAWVDRYGFPGSPGTATSSRTAAQSRCGTCGEPIVHTDSTPYNRKQQGWSHMGTNDKTRGHQAHPAGSTASFRDFMDEKSGKTGTCKHCGTDIEQFAGGGWQKKGGGAGADICMANKGTTRNYGGTHHPASKTADRTGPTIDSAEGYEYTPAPEWVQKACRGRFEGGGVTAMDPKHPGHYLHGVGNWWDGPHEVKDNGDHTLSFTNPYDGRTDRFDEHGYYRPDGTYVNRAEERRMEYGGSRTAAFGDDSGFKPGDRVEDKDGRKGTVKGDDKGMASGEGKVLVEWDDKSQSGTASGQEWKHTEKSKPGGAEVKKSDEGKGDDKSGDEGGNPFAKKSSYENPTPNCLKIMELQSAAYDELGINGFSGDPNDPNRLKVIQMIENNIGDLDITQDDIDSLEDNNAHAGAEAASHVLYRKTGGRTVTAIEGLDWSDLRKTDIGTMKAGDRFYRPSAFEAYGENSETGEVQGMGLYMNGRVLRIDSVDPDGTIHATDENDPKFTGSQKPNAGHKVLKVVSSKTTKVARVQQIVYQGPSHDQDFSVDGPDANTLRGLIGKFVEILFYNEHGVATDYELGRITEVNESGERHTPGVIMSGLTQFWWQRADGPQGQYANLEPYPVLADDVYRITRLEEPVSADQGRLFASKTAMPSPADAGIEVGDIYVNSWGYDQTNIDFYEVTRLMGASVAVRPIAKEITSTGPQDTVVPKPGQFTGPEVTKRIPAGGGGWLNWNSFSGLSKWDGSPMSQTGWGYGH